MNAEPPLRRQLFDSYDRRTDALDHDQGEKLAWFRRYAARAYLPHLPDPNVDLLEIGCNRAYLLAALGEVGFARLTGVDLSPGDIEKAREIAPRAELVCAPAAEFLAARESAYDVIVMKAVLEHVPKSEVIPLVRAIARSLRPAGTALIDVPNMDWLFAAHERYMDFTHEVGFTRESLDQVLAEAFDDIEIHPFDHTAQTRKTRIARRILRWLLKWSDPEAGIGPIWARSLVAVAKSPRVLR